LQTPLNPCRPRTRRQFRQGKKKKKTPFLPGPSHPNLVCTWIKHLDIGTHKMYPVRCCPNLFLLSGRRKRPKSPTALFLWPTSPPRRSKFRTCLPYISRCRGWVGLVEAPGCISWSYQSLCKIIQVLPSRHSSVICHLFGTSAEVFLILLSHIVEKQTNHRNCAPFLSNCPAVWDLLFRPYLLLLVIFSTSYLHLPPLSGQGRPITSWRLHMLRNNESR
jgi:hypothetical protein